MADYKTMYGKLFNVITDVIRILQMVQAETEEVFINQEEAKIVQLKRLDDSE